MAKMTEAQRKLLQRLSTMLWYVPEDRGKVALLGHLRRMKLVSYLRTEQLWRINDAGRAALEGKPE